TEHEPHDAEIVAAARAAIDDLNARYPGEAGGRFFLFRRERRWKKAKDCGWDGSANAEKSRSSTIFCAARAIPPSPCRSAICQSFLRSATVSRSIRIRGCRATRRASWSASSRTRSIGRDSIHRPEIGRAHV